MQEKRFNKNKLAMTVKIGQVYLYCSSKAQHKGELAWATKRITGILQELHAASESSSVYKDNDFIVKGGKVSVLSTIMANQQIKAVFSDLFQAQLAPCSQGLKLTSP